MSVNLSNLGQIVMASAGTGSGNMSISCPTLAASRAISIDDPLSDCKLSLSRKNSVAAATNVTRALNVNESDSIQLVSAAAARILTLPVVATSAGCRFRFVIQVAGANTVTIRCPAGTLQGVVTTGADGAANHVVALNQADLVFAVNQSLGAWSEFYCDGTYYYVSGASGIAAGFTTA